MTLRSRIESIGGLVTWANFCLKYVYSGRAGSCSTESGVSSPIEPTGSFACRAIGFNTYSISSLLNPCRICRDSNSPSSG